MNPLPLRHYRRLLTYVRPYLSSWLIALLGYALFASGQPMLALILKHLVDGLTDPAKALLYLPTGHTLALSTWTPLFLVLIALWQGLGTLLGHYGMARVAAGVVHDLRRDAYRHLLSLPYPYHLLHDSGRTISRLTHDVLTTTTAVTDAVRILVREGFTVIALLLYLLWANPLLTLILLLLFPPLLLIVRSASRRLRALARARQQTIGDLTGLIAETVRAILEIKAFTAEEALENRFTPLNRQERQRQEQLARLAARQTVLTQLLTFTAIGLLLSLLLTLRGEATPGDLVAYVTAAALLPKPLRQLADLQARLATALAGAESIFELLDTPPESETGSYAPALPSLSSPTPPLPSPPAPFLAFTDVTYTYPHAATPALERITLSLPPGGLTAIVGRSGSGKTTLMRLLLRLDDPQSGLITLLGVPLPLWQRAALRRHIAYVPQHPNFFTGTIAENLSLAAPSPPTEAQLQAVLQAAHAWEFIAALPQGLATPIGENGAQLSGGQRQRLAIARALLKQAPLLILDEPTSALDPESEEAIRATLLELKHHRTLLIIAHRLTTIEHADCTVLLDAGRLIAIGTHAELLATHALYRHLYRSGSLTPHA
ncbi:MAG: ABC transporter transmembrane domain-containing protein [Hydrogenophilus sp.]|nr:ABC transporter transmembrane domain-containing protein [Hydrogenophilus sp.]